MFRFTTAGESHGRALVAILEGLPAGLPVDVEQINGELNNRKSLRNKKEHSCQKPERD